MNKQEENKKFKGIIEENKGLFLKVARAYCSNEEDRQDLLQEIMIQVWQSLDKFSNQSKISTWLYRISLNVAISFYRKNSTRENKYIELSKRTEQFSTDDTTETEQQLNLLEQFISELKEIDKALILLYLEDKSHIEIADILGISTTNVGTKIGRIKNKLKHRFLNLNL
jgi:RNA polymerase sigma-70 factor (ECF subfamily)